jgi:hypothetical protein
VAGGDDEEHDEALDREHHAMRALDMFQDVGDGSPVRFVVHALRPAGLCLHFPQLRSHFLQRPSALHASEAAQSASLAGMHNA